MLRSCSSRLRGLLSFIVAGAIVVVDLVLFYISKATFRREEIFAEWK